MGYERYRELVFERQKELGIFPPDAELSPLNPYAEETSADGKPWTAARRGAPVGLAVRGREARCSAAWPRCTPASSSHTDHEIGRLLDFLEESGRARQHDRRASCSDNGASGEGGPNGSVNENKFFNGIPDDDRGEPASTSTSSARRRPTTTTRSAGRGRSTRPFKMWKRYNFEGGVADPLIVSWPAGIEAKGELRHQFLPRHRHRADDLRLPRRRAAGGRSRATRRSRWRA